MYRQDHDPPGSCTILALVWSYPLKVDSTLCTLFYTTVNEVITFLRVLLHNQMHKERKSCCFARLSITCNVQPLCIFLPLLSTWNSCNAVREYPCSNKSLSITFCYKVGGLKDGLFQLHCLQFAAVEIQVVLQFVVGTCSLPFMDVLISFLITMASLHPIVCFGCIVVVSKFYCYKEGQFHNSDIETDRHL